MDLPNPEIEPGSPALQVDSLPVELPGSRMCLLTKQPTLTTSQGFPGGSDGKEPACNVGDLGSIPGLERSPGEGNGNSLQ